MRTMRYIATLFAVLLACGIAKAAVTAESVLAASDAVRNPGRSFSVTVTLTEFQAGKQVDTSTLSSYSRLKKGGQYANLVRFVLPARDAGKIMLKNGNEMWFYDASSKATIRLSPQQRLLGQASNGDVATVNMATDYKSESMVGDELQNGERQLRKAHKLMLTADSPDAMYASIELWVDTENNRPIKARFFSDSSRLLKTIYYRKFQMQLGAERPTESVIIDGLDPQSVTLMRFTEYQAIDIPDAWMQKEYLPRFRP